MSLEVQGSTQISPASGDDVANSVSSKESISYDTHRRLLAQRKKDQERIRELEAFKEDLDLQRKEAEGKKDEVIQSLRESKDKSEREKLSILQSFTKKTVRSEVAKEALARGLRPDRLNSFLKLSEDSFIDNSATPIQIDESFNIVNRDVFNSIMDKESLDCSDWFVKQAAQPNDVVPGVVNTSIPDKKLEEKTVDELADML